jgi:uncharacterized coiled-coil protein SlyX
MQPGPQPFITIAVSDALARIEAKLDGLMLQLAQKADAGVVHEMDTRLRVLETSQASQTAVVQALGRAKASIWVAVGSMAAAITAIIYVVDVTRGR